jgi:hypothetical protein
MVVAALAVLVLAFWVQMRPAGEIAGSDVTVYETYGSRMADGAVPYRDFRMEYPPGAALLFVLPALAADAGGSGAAAWEPVNGAGRRYYHAFEALVLLLLVATLVLTALTLAAMRRSTRMAALSLAVVACSPLLIGQVLPERYDVFPAALTAAALAAAVRGRLRLGAVLLGVGAAVKVYPVLLVPVLAIVALRRRGVREAVVVAGASLGAAVALFVPFAAASLSGTIDSVRVQLHGGLQIESLASSVLVMAEHGADRLTALGLPPPSRLDTQSAGGGLIRTDLVGSGVEATRIVTNVLLAAALLLLWIGLARSTRDVREELLRYAAATVAAALALGPVLSPQYVVWLVPLVPLVGGRRGVAAVVLFVAAAVLTNAWFPGMYFDYQGDLAAGEASVLLLRNLLLLATALVLVVPAGFLGRLVGSAAAARSVRGETV